MKRGREYHGCGEEYSVEKKGKGKQYHLPYNIEDVEKNIKWLKEKEDGNFGAENQDFKTWGWDVDVQSVQGLRVFICGNIKL